MSTQSEYLDRCIAEKKAIDARVTSLVAHREELTSEVYLAMAQAIREDRSVLAACCADWKRQSNQLRQ